MISHMNSHDKTTGAVGSYLLAEPSQPQPGMSPKELRDAALALASAAEQVVLVLGIRSFGYGNLNCGRACVAPPCPRGGGYAPDACKSHREGDMSNFTDPKGVYGNVVGGTTSYNHSYHPGDEFIENETHDRTSIDLPAPQRALVRAQIVLYTVLCSMLTGNVLIYCMGACYLFIAILDNFE